MPFGAARINTISKVLVAAEVIRLKIGVSAIGNAQIDTAQSKFGGASALFDGNGDYLIVNEENKFRASDPGDLTFDCWFRTAATGAIQPLISKRQSNGGAGEWEVIIQADATIRALVYGAAGNASTHVDITGAAVSTNTWYHVALVRNGSTWTLYLDGVSQGTGTQTTTPIVSSQRPLIGTMYGFTTSRVMNGHIDEVRISNVARYTSNFTPSTTPFVNDENTLLLLHMDGPDVGTSFEDDNGVRQKVGMTYIGNAQVDTAQSKFGGASGLFDGSGDGIIVYKAAMPLSGDFTVEYWIYQTLDSTDYHLGQYSGASTGRFNMGYDAADDKIFYFWGGTSYPGQQKTSTAISLNTWYHVALTREGGTLRLFLNGTLENTQTGYTSIVVQDTNFTVGYAPALASTQGNIDEVRISNVARYTSNFTPSTTPFVNDANTLLLMHMDGTDASTVFDDDNGVPGTLTSVRTANTVTALGDAQVDTAQSKFGGASAYFDGTGDYLAVNDQSSGAQIIPSTGTFTFEMWVYFTNTSAQRTVISQYGYLNDANPAGRLVLRSDSATSVRLFIDGIINVTTTIATNTWYHFALSRDSSNVFRWYKDGVQVGTATSSNSIAGGYTAIGALSNTGGTNMFGYIDEVRISNIARYTTAFTPPAQAFVNDSNTLLLLHMDGADASTTFTDDTESITGRTKIGVAAIGNAQVDTAQSKFGGASYLGDGTDDALTSPSSSIWAFGTGDFTIEAWVRFASAALMVIVSLRNASASIFSNVLVIRATGVLGWSNGSVYRETTTTVPTGQWAHVAASRSSGVLKLFIDGVEGLSITETINLTGNRPLYIGRFDTNFNSFNGHIDEVRISNTARYTANFTPQTTPFQNDSNTLLLLHMDGTDGTTYFPDDNGVPPDYDYGP